MNIETHTRQILGGDTPLFESVTRLYFCPDNEGRYTREITRVARSKNKERAEMMANKIAFSTYAMENPYFHPAPIS